MTFSSSSAQFVENKVIEFGKHKNKQTRVYHDQDVQVVVANSYNVLGIALHLGSKTRSYMDSEYNLRHSRYLKV